MSFDWNSITPPRYRMRDKDSILRDVYTEVVRYLDVNRKFGITSEGMLVKLTPGAPWEAQEIPRDEPVFVMRARDYLALPTLHYYRDACRASECTEFHLKAIDASIRDFIDFMNSHRNQMKQPGSTLGKI